MSRFYNRSKGSTALGQVQVLSLFVQGRSPVEVFSAFLTANCFVFNLVEALCS